MQKNRFGELCKLRRINRLLQEYEEKFTEVYALTLHEGMLLYSLDGERLKANEIATRLGLRPSYCSKLLGRLENAEYIVRELDATDKRCMYFSLSKSGESLIEKILTAASIAVPELQQLLQYLAADD